MENKLIKALEEQANCTLTENGAVTYRSTLNGMLDLFALGGAYRSRSDLDVIKLFMAAFNEDETYALKCLFYLRDIREGQGERRFFKVVIKWLACNHTDAIKRNLKHIPEFGRWDDLYALVGTPLERTAFNFMLEQFKLDLDCNIPSLLGKWLKSENTGSAMTCRLANKTRIAFGLSHKQYRKSLSLLRKKINVLERLMSANKWDEIEFDKIPSKAGMLYRNAFARHDVERMRLGASESFEDFVKSDKEVNVQTLYPYEVVKKACEFEDYNNIYDLKNTQRLLINKYWENLKDTLDGYKFNGICVADTSGSMYGTPLFVAISLALYCAEHTSGPYAHHFFTFSSRPDFITVKGSDFVDKVTNIRQADWGMNTNIKAVFDQILDLAVSNNLKQEDIPENVIIISDMEFDAATRNGTDTTILFESIEQKWQEQGYKMPLLTFWNVDARQNNIPMRSEKYVNFVSGFSQNIFDSLMKGLTAMDLMMEKLNSPRYVNIK